MEIKHDQLVFRRDQLAHAGSSTGSSKVLVSEGLAIKLESKRQKKGENKLPAPTPAPSPPVDTDVEMKPAEEVKPAGDIPEVTTEANKPKDTLEQSAHAESTVDPGQSTNVDSVVNAAAAAA